MCWFCFLETSAGLSTTESALTGSTPSVRAIDGINVIQQLSAQMLVHAENIMSIPFAGLVLNFVEGFSVKDFCALQTCLREYHRLITELTKKTFIYIRFSTDLSRRRQDKGERETIRK